LIGRADAITTLKIIFAADCALTGLIPPPILMTDGRCPSLRYCALSGRLNELGVLISGFGESMSG